MFGITDSKDILLQTSIVNIFDLPNINKLEPKRKADENWNSKLKNDELYRLYKRNKDILDDNIIDDNDYNILFK